MSNAKSICTFLLENAYFGIELKFVMETFYLPKQILKIPMAAPFLSGVVAYEQAPLPILRIHSFLNLAESAQTETTSVIAIEVNRFRVGIWSDAVPRLITVPAEQIIETDQPHPYISSLCKSSNQLISLLDTPALLESAHKQVESD